MLRKPARGLRIVSRRARFHATILSALLLLLSQQGVAAPITIPTGLLPGAQYRLAFVTAGTRDATSTSIADYDAFVTAEANTELALSSISWQVIGSTASVNAPSHTGTDPSHYPGFPIFLLNDVKLVDDYLDLWDGFLDVPLRVDQHGSISAVERVWTGTNNLGSPYFPLGTSTPSYGLGITELFHWSVYSQDMAENPLSLYAISAVLIAPVPETSTTALLTLGLVALLLVRRVRAA